MIKNYSVREDKQNAVNQQLAKQIVAQSDLMSSLETQNYKFCLYVGNLYETAGEYTNAEYAYNMAVNKAKPGLYTAHTKLVKVLAEQNKIQDAIKIIDSVMDINNLQVIKFKTRAYLTLGDKYYSIGKFIQSSKNYEKAKYYYDHLKKKDEYVEKAINQRIVKAYNQSATVLVQNGYNSDAARFLKKAQKYLPEDYNLKYKLAIIYSDLDPIVAVKYFDELLDKIPQQIDYNIYNRTLMKAANIADLEGNEIQAKYYRYKIHSKDLFINQKVVYADDLELIQRSFNIKKRFFKYHIKGSYIIKNVSNVDIYKMYVDFVLRNGETQKELYQVECVNKKHPLYSNGGETEELKINFGKNIYTKKELSNYFIDIFVYKDKKFKTLISSFPIVK